MGKRIIAIVLVVVGVLFLGFGGYRYLMSRKPNAGLKVQTNPGSLVFVDNVQIGDTPIEKIFKPGEVSLKIIPNSTDSALTTYQTKVRLSPQTFAVVRRDFGPTDQLTAGEIITLEPQSTKQASMSVVTSSPDSASVTIDGQPQGFSPVLIPSIEPGDHQIVVSAPGFVTRTIDALVIPRHKLSLNVKLAGEVVVVPTPTPTPAEATPSGTPKVTPKITPKPTSKTTSSVTKPYVEIKDTPTGFLRVRQTPSTAAQEMGQVNPGDRFSLLDASTGWYMIAVELEATSSGWISAQYADKFE